MWERESNCSRVGTVGTESAVRKRGGNRNLPYLNAANSVTVHAYSLSFFKKKTYGSHPSRHPAVLTAADVWSSG